MTEYAEFNLWVGEQPVDPLIIDTGTRDISALTPTLVGPDVSSLPDYVVDIYDGAAGQVAVTFTEPFIETAALLVQVKLEAGDGSADLTAPVVFRVRNVTDDAELTILTPLQAEAITGQTVTQVGLLAAQGLVGLILDRDLSSSSYIATLGTADMRRLKQAVAWQAGVDPAETLAGQVPAGATAVSNGDVSMTFAPTRDSLYASLHLYAQLALNQLSWRSGIRAIHLQPTGAHKRFDATTILTSDEHPWVAM